MKTLLLLLLPLISFAQPNPEPTKGDNLIEITSTQPDSVLYLKTGQVLLESGYTFKADKDFKTFKTDERAVLNYPSYLSAYSINIRNGVVKIAGTLHITIGISIGAATTQGTTLPLEYRKGNTDMRGRGFRVLMDIANKMQTAFSPATLTYKKQ